MRDVNERNEFKKLLASQVRVPEAVKDLLVESLYPSVRLQNVINSLAIRTLGDLDGRTFGQIFSAKNCGETTLLELKLLISVAAEDSSLNQTSIDEFDESRASVPSVPDYVSDLPIKYLVAPGRLRSFLNSYEVKTLGDLNDLFRSRLEKKSDPDSSAIGEAEALANDANSGHFDHYVIGEQPLDLKRSLVCELNRRIEIPSAAKDISILRVPFSTRLFNALRSFDIGVLGDLQQITYKDLKSRDGCGKDTVFELWQYLANLTKGLSDGGNVCFPEFNTGVGSELSLPSLLNLINDYLSGIASRDREILLARFGGNSDEALDTLEEIGSEFGITRERVRQIESKHLKHLQRQTSGQCDLMFDQLIAECILNVCPLTTRLLVLMTGNEYSLFQFPPRFYLLLLRELRPELPIFDPARTIPDRRIKRVQSVVDGIRTILEHELGFVTLARTFSQISEHPLIHKLGATAFFDAVQANDFVIEFGDSPAILLIALRSLRLTNIEMARRVLSESTGPLTPEQILVRLVNKFGSEVELPSPNSLANLPGYDSTFYLLDRRTIGLRKHFRLPEQRWHEVKDDCYEFLKDKRKPISTSHILASTNFEWTRESNSSELAAILREDDRFVDLGRFLFALKVWGISKRESIKDLITRVLTESEIPLRASEIGERVRNYRSFSETSLPALLRGHPDVRELGFGYYVLNSKTDHTNFICTNEQYLKRIVRQLAPISFNDLCKTLDLSNMTEARKTLLTTLRSIPQIQLSPDDLNEVSVTFNRFALRK